MSRLSVKMCGGMARSNVVEHAGYVKPVSHNPYLGSIHDGVSTDYNEGFTAKIIPWLYRFRHNYLPQGRATGFFAQNPYGRYVHWLEVSTLEKMRLQALTVESMPSSIVIFIVCVYTFWFMYRLAFLHPDLTLYNLGLWTTKPWVMQERFNKKVELDQPVYRWIHRAPEYYIPDPYRDIVRMDTMANDPLYEIAKEKGKVEDLLLTAWERTSTRPNLATLLQRDHHESSDAVRWP